MLVVPGGQDGNNHPEDSVCVVMYLFLCGAEWDAAAEHGNWMQDRAERGRALSFGV